MAVGGPQFGLALVGAVAPVVGVLPEVPLHREPQAPELTEDAHPVRHDRKHPRAGIHVHVLHVAVATIGPAARAVDEARRIAFLDPLENLVGVVLPPALVERHPDDNRREEPEPVDHRGGLRAELRLLLRGELAVLLPVGLDELLPSRPHPARLILPDKQSEGVAVVVVAGRLHLDVLAEHVHAEGLEHLEVGLHRCVARRREQAVGPPALVERANLKQRLAIEAEPEDPLLVAGLRDRTEREVGPHPIAHLAIGADKLDLDGIEVRIVGRPEARLLDGEADRLAGSPLTEHLARGPLSLDDADARWPRTGWRLPGEVDRELDLTAFHVGDGKDAADVTLINRLHPHRLPDAADGRVPDPFGLELLLAARLRPLIRRIPDANEQFIGTRLEMGGDIERKRIGAAAVIAELRPVEPHARVPVDGVEAEHDPLPLPRLRHGDRAPVPEQLLLRNAPPHPRQRRLWREGDEDVSIPCRGRCAVGRRHATLAGRAIDD